MAFDFAIKKGDTNPALKARLKDVNGRNVDITGSNVDFHMRPEGENEKKIQAVATITNAQNGEVEYDWEVGDTDDPGRYEAEFQVNYSNGDVETFPNDGYIIIKIDPEVA